jgi:hypothetical protein
MVVLVCLLMGFAHAPPALTQQDNFSALKKSHPIPFYSNKPYTQEIPEPFKLVAENTTFQLYFDNTSLAFKVADKRNGYVWHSNLDKKLEGDRLNRTWLAFASSGISIDYLDQKALSKRASITNTNVDIQAHLIENGIQAEVRFLDPSISLNVILQLEEQGVSIEVPFHSIKQENPDFKLGMLHVYPFLGATRGDSVPGYMFLPDGCGTIIRFQAETKANNMFYGRYYGKDLGMLTELPHDPSVNRPYLLSVPVIGMVHEEKQNAYIAVIETGAAYGEIHAHPAGITTNFNFLYNAFIYNESYFQATNRSGAGVTTLQPETNAFDIKIHYRFLSGNEADYVGMARSYQQYLVDKGMLTQKINPGSDIGIRLEFLGAEKEKVLFWNRTIPMTTVSQMKEILSQLEVKNPEIVYYGWQPLGATSVSPTKFTLDRKLGNTKQLQSLIDTVVAEGGAFYFYLDPQAAIKDERGYSPRHDLAMSITSLNLAGYNRGKVNFYFNIDVLHQRYQSISGDIFSQFNAGLALDNIGSTLYSDFKKGHFLNRQKAIARYQQILSEREGVLAFYSPNDYVFAYMNAYFDMPLSDSGYVYTLTPVPFLQIVLSGYVPYYGPALNFSSNLKEDLLRQVDYGVYPSFFVTLETTDKILLTNSNWIYSSSFRQWEEAIEYSYRWLNERLGPVKGQEIVAREMLQEGVTVTTYANGKQIIVNFNDEPYQAGGIWVDSLDAILRDQVP